MIRRANPNDVRLLQQIGRKTFDDAFGNTCTKEDMQGVLAMYFDATQVAYELIDDADNFFFFEEDCITKAYLRINAKHPCPLDAFQHRKCIELVRLYVLKEFHGTGVANALMDFAIDFAKKKIGI